MNNKSLLVITTLLVILALGCFCLALGVGYQRINRGPDGDDIHTLF